MNRIRLLPEQVANQIAAGEVVERPASVVKELVENSLDAGAGRISVTIKNGGRSLINVSDDGCGMGRDDALLALERHATSKISKAEDLHSITSLGFRGEAIPSVAAVSRFTLSSRERGTLNGTQIEIAGGKILSVIDVGAAEGTVVEVRNLFFNLPARRKFLRSLPTETAHIEHIVTLCALAHPNVAFKLVIDGRETFNLAPTKELPDRLRELNGAQLVEQLVPVGLSCGSLEARVGATSTSPKVASAIQVSGFIGRPGVSRSDRSQQHLFVNRRPVESKGINYALLEGYHTALMKGKFPVTFLFIDIDPELVDVNIHPAKREVRFRDEFAVRQAVIDAVRTALEPKGEVRPVRIDVVSAVPGGAVVGSAVSSGPAATAAVPGEVAAPEELAGGSRNYIQSDFEPPVETPAEVPAAEGGWRVVGVIGQLYVLLESPEGLVLMDQHAAHERVLFEKMLKELETDSAPSQKLLLPLTLELDARDAAFLQANEKVLQKLGIGVNEFGERTFLIDALPPYFPTANLAQTFRDIVDELRQTGEQIHARRLGEDKIATTVCRHAVKAHDPLRGEELRALLQQLHQCDLPYTCPHGRPTMIQISYAELEKKFGRKV
ncbi:MAG TPA: DNA mismatch repair endonuclease MutL [Verrucomicrobiae bacterium]|nr:DNA mismatch repair endonuclease MutL [Verrucomicrobiae bacterium]